jgi:hypothetical protein
LQKEKAASEVNSGGPDLKVANDRGETNYESGFAGRKRLESD